MHRQLHPEEPEIIDCELCLNEIPGDNGVNHERDDYVLHFCGIECYRKWKEKQARDAP